MKKTLTCAFGGALLGGVLALSACGDDVTKVYQTAEENSGMEIAKSADDFGDCDSASIGKTAFASDEGVGYVCADSGWVPLSENSSVGCSAELLSDSTGYKIVCGEDSVGVILNGKEGETGASGKNGASCSAEKLSGSTGYKIVCGEDSVGVILNGETGAAGKSGTSCSVEMLADSTGYKVVCGEDSVGVILNGLDGNGCTLTDKGNGTFSQVCGTDTVILYKAFCGGNVYDPVSAFCLENTLYSCGGKAYDPTENFCFADSAYALCGGKTYDPTNYICYEDSVYAYCAGEAYDPAKNFCFEDSVYTACGGKSWVPGKEFCDERDSSVYGYVQIGTQIWMAENLNYNYNVETAASYCYNDSIENCEEYGRLYTWAAAMDSAAVFSDDGKGCGYEATCIAADTVRGVCPEGWHLPSSDEWGVLTVYLRENANDGEYFAGELLKAKSGWREDDGANLNEYGNGSDSFGFGGLPAGFRNYLGFIGKTESTYFWNSTENVSGYITPVYGLAFHVAGWNKSGSDKEADAFSVRCIKD
jgi:uncharacterized protein (TIGR02145 family)